MEGNRRSCKVIEDLFLSSDSYISSEKSYGWVCCGDVRVRGGLQDYSDSPSPIPTLDLNFLDLDWTGLDLGLRNWDWACQLKTRKVESVVFAV